jgi:hypothetical protein
MNSNEKIMAAVGLLGLAAIIIIFGPLAVIWSWNQLFGDIKILEYSFWNWPAVMGLGLLFKQVKIERKK